ncbi:leucyl aminopeptidase [Gynuella sp.]|uniref:leucyl aminopeptidase n=1 Tax=Gynuella sp. TaxID=2969146 RepID=UPI003D10341F
MKVSASNVSITQIQSQALFVFHFENGNNKTIDLLAEHSKSIAALADEGLLSTEPGTITPVFNAEGLAVKIVYAVGCGKADNFNENAFIKAIKAIAETMTKAKLNDATVALDNLSIQHRSIHWKAQKFTEVCLSSFYKYDATLSDKSGEPCLEQLTLHSQETNLELAIDTGRSIAHGINVARELGNLPGNICTPTYLAEQGLALAGAYSDIEAQVIDEKELDNMGAGCFMSVSRGSDQPGKLIIIQYKGAEENQKPYVLVGKGVTFDTGGISLKPGPGMDEMKFDMCGAASVLGTMNTLAELKPSINVVGIIAAVENMPSAIATKPGDVVTSLSGKTVEILNTDAEGRLVLCDALTYAERFEPESVIDIATLTGAIVVALGHHPTGVFANDETLQQELVTAGQEVWDRGWPMPIWDEYKEELKSPYADLANIGTAGRAGGSNVAAAFLSAFTEKFKWAHLDIAGTAWNNRKEGASGRPVAMLTQYLLDRC